MSPEAQRIAIAKKCRWKYCCVTRLGGKDRFWGVKPGALEKTDDLPDYLNDLNAMHEAEKTLHHTVYPRYVHLLVCGEVAEASGYQGTVLTLGAVLNSHAATAAQRAEAFLRTIGEWID